MDYLLGSVFSVLECPRLRIKKPSWVQLPSRMTVFSFVLFTYFLVTGGHIGFDRQGLYSVTVLQLLFFDFQRTAFDKNIHM
uniref:Oligosaccharyltransferase complex subunit n=1 Tax=Mesocestoides corti TaxID=53468 RepID=A0A5K3ESB1_MESCO